MNKIALVFFFYIIGNSLMAQKTKAESTLIPFKMDLINIMVTLDIDGDKNQDILVSGYNKDNSVNTKLLKNEGSGNFKEVIGTPFESLSIFSIAHSDIDGDKDQDLIIAGSNSSRNAVTKVYRNDGKGNYTEDPYSLFKQVSHLGSISCADIDGDKDQDLLISGRTDKGLPITRLYSNDGAGSYSEVTTNIPFGQTIVTSLFLDIDADEDLDLITAGISDTRKPTTTLYKNDSKGNFIRVNQTPFENIYRAALTSSDIDGDKDEDIIISGINQDAKSITRVYLNDGLGNYKDANVQPFNNVATGTLDMLDIDSDKDLDIIITGMGRKGKADMKTFDISSLIYMNDGVGNYSKAENNPLEAVYMSNSIFIDIDGDKDKDLIITGRNNMRKNVSSLYLNEGSNYFPEIRSSKSFESETKNIDEVIYENEYLQIKHPVAWEVPEEGNFTIKMPAYNNYDAGIRISATPSFKPPIIQSMLGDLDMLYYDGMEYYVADMKYSQVTIDGKQGYLIDKSNTKKKHLEYIFHFDDQSTNLTILVKTTPSFYGSYESAIKKAIESIKFKDFKTDKKLTLTETTETEITELWANQVVQRQGSSEKFNVTKLDNILYDIESVHTRLTITDTNIEIDNWADFFEWKSKSALKDYEVFAHDNSPGGILNIFSHYMHLGDYDNLRIHQLPSNELKFEFSKKNGALITWIVEYTGSHQLPIDKDILLNRFIYVKTQSYKRKSDGKLAYEIPILINDIVYRIKVENISVK